MARLSLQFFGAFDARLAGEPLPGLRSVRIQALLAFLALEIERPHTRAALAFLLWPDEPEHIAKQNLRQALYQLRQGLGEGIEPFLLITRDTVQFNAGSDYTSDIAEFMLAVGEGRLAHAAELYAAEPFEQLSNGSERFEEWLVFRREQLHVMVMDVLHRLTNNALDEADYVLAQHYARRQLAFEPWRESAHRQYILATAANGDRSSALVQYETCRRILADELGVEPDAETVALVNRIRIGALDLRPSLTSLTTPLESKAPKASSADTDVPPPTHGKSAIALQDWGEAPDTPFFQGRQQELAELHRRATTGQCRIITILGMGGMGKTALAATAARRLAGEFDHVIWRSLLNAPPLSEIIYTWLQFLADQPLTQLPDGLDAQLSLLFERLRTRRCLLVLDNAESIHQTDARAGALRPGYEEYGQLFRRMGETPHDSCLLLTSREQPQEIAQLERISPLIYSLNLTGVSYEAGRAILRTQGIEGEPTIVQPLIERYSGNPLALILIAETIDELYGGDVEAFLSEEAPVFDDIRKVLDQQFARLSQLEQEVLYTLAIEREPCTMQQLTQRLMRSASKRDIIEAVNSLRRRSLIEKAIGPQTETQSGSGNAGFTLQNVVMEYVTNDLCERIEQEIDANTPALMVRHALLETQAKEYIRLSQVRLLLDPIAVRLVARLGRTEAASRCLRLISTFRRTPTSGFGSGNMLNLLFHLGFDPALHDFSSLQIWQADFRNVDLIGVDLRGADLTGCLFTDYVGSVTSVAYSPDGELIAAGADSGAIYLWRLADRQLIGACFGHLNHVWSLAFGRDSRTLVSGSGDATVRIWDVKTRQTLHRLEGHTAGVSTIAIHPDRSIVASGSLDQTIRLWDMHTGENIDIIHGHNAKVECISFSPDGALLAAAGHDQMVHIWDWQEPRLLRTLAGHNNLVKAVCFRPRTPGKAERLILASGGDDRTVILWDPLSGARIASLKGHAAAVLTATFTADGAWLLTGSDDQTIRVWDMQALDHGDEWQHTSHVLHGHYGAVRSISTYPANTDDLLLAASASYDKTIRLWDLRTLRTLAILRGHSKWLQALAYTRDGLLLAAGSDGQHVRVWDGRSGHSLHTLSGHTSLTEKITFGPEGAVVASAGWDQTARIWDLQRGKSPLVLRDHAGGVAIATPGPQTRSGSQIATGGMDQFVRVWDATSGNLIAAWPGHRGRIAALAFSKDGSLLASGAWDSSIGLWDLKRGELIWFLHGHAEAVESVAFHPDGELLASASWDRTVRIWDLHSGRTVHILQGHYDGLEMVTFSPDGAILASCACDHLICIWDVRTGQLLYTLRGHESWVRCVAFSPDGAQLASGSDDGTVKIWDVTPAGSGACLATVAMDDPYAGMRIAGVTGVTPAQRAVLIALGAQE